MTRSNRALGASILAAGLVLLAACGPESTATNQSGPTLTAGPSTTPTSVSSPQRARPGTVAVLVRGAGFCTRVPAIPSPECDPRPLPGVAVVVRDAGGATAARGVTGQDGRVVLDVPPGPYVVTSDPVPGFAEAARPVPTTAQPGERVDIVLTHNTGYQ